MIIIEVAYQCCKHAKICSLKSEHIFLMLAKLQEDVHDSVLIGFARKVSKNAAAFNDLY